VDDEADIREPAAHHLAAAGFQVLEAATGMEGWERASRHGPDLVLLDIMLPDIPAHIKRLRSKLGTAAARVETLRGVGYRFRE